MIYVLRAIRDGRPISIQATFLFLAAALSVLTAAPARAGTPAPGFSDTQIVAGLSQPTAIAFLPDGRMLVTEQGGALKLASGGSASLLTTIPVCSADEMGLLGIAVDPDFSANGHIYLYRTKPAPGGDPCASTSERVNQLVRVTMSAGAIDLGSLSVLIPDVLTGSSGHHNGGTVRVGNDGRLYVSVGDTGLGDGGAPGDSTNPYAQDLGQLEGKLLRVERDGAIPPDNPFVGTPGARPEVFAFGFRNPFRFGIDPVTGLPWVGDVGQNTLEEIDIVVAAGNYSWPYCEGSRPAGCMQPGDRAPILDYPQSGPSTLGNTVIAGSFTDFGAGCEHFFADFGASKLYRATPNAARDGLAAYPTTFVSAAGGPVDVITGPDRNLYYVSLFNGDVRQVAGATGAACAPAATAPPDTPPAAVDRTAPRQRLRARRLQDIDKLLLRNRLDEAGRLVVSGTVRFRRNASRVVRFRRISRAASAGRTVKLRPRLRKVALRSVKRALRGQRLRARIRVVAIDGAGNRSAARISIRLKR